MSDTRGSPREPRRPGDVVRLVLSAAVVLTSAWLAHRAHPGVVEVDAFRFVNDLPATFAGFVVHVASLAVIALLLHSSGTRLHFSGPDLPDRWLLLLGVIAVLVAMGLVRWGRTLQRHVAPPLRSAIEALGKALRRPSSAAALFLGSAGVTTGYALALAATCQAFGIRLGVMTIVAVYLGAAAIGSVAPTPGGLGALEAALAAGLVAAGTPTGPAIAAVLTYRLITYWLPVIPGVVSYRVLRRDGTL